MLPKIGLERLSRWRDICPDLTVRSTFIVGFPGETEAEFERAGAHDLHGRLT